MHRCFLKAEYYMVESSPRTLGLTGRARHSRGAWLVFPAYVGVNLYAIQDLPKRTQVFPTYVGG